MGFIVVDEYKLETGNSVSNLYIGFGSRHFVNFKRADGWHLTALLGVYYNKEARDNNYQALYEITIDILTDTSLNIFTQIYDEAKNKFENCTCVDD